MRSLRLRRSRQKAPVDSNVDLVPMMCLLCILIPMLLVTAVFERLAALNTHLPHASTIGGAEEAGKAPEKQGTGVVELRVGVHARGFRVEGTLSHDPSGKEKDVYQDIAYDIPLKGEEEYDLDTLRQTLLSLKQQYPRHEEVVLLVDDAIPYDVIVQTMDTCREEVYEDQGEVIRHALFPNIALSESFDESKGFDGLRQGTREINKKLGLE
jgi:biopolymer transport protein ExbD